MDYAFRALSSWPGTRMSADDRRVSSFSAAWNKTLSLLEKELCQLDATNVIIEADCDESQIRRDGMLKSDARLKSSGVVLSFDSNAGAMRIPCETFLNWQDNIRAIAMSLEALRLVKRYGVAMKGEQYKGWRALEDKRLPASQFANRDEAANYLVTLATKLGLSSVPSAGAMLQSPAIRKAFRVALLTVTAPDRNDGNGDDFKMVNEAFDKIGTE